MDGGCGCVAHGLGPDSLSWLLQKGKGESVCVILKDNSPFALSRLSPQPLHHLESPPVALPSDLVLQKTGKKEGEFLTPLTDRQGEKEAGAMEA